jgi:hypothetical protein
MYRVENTMKAKRDVVVSILGRWHATTKVESHDALRDHLRRIAEHTAAGNVAVEQPYKAPSALDEVMTGGRTKSVNQVNRRIVRGLKPAR